MGPQEEELEQVWGRWDPWTAEEEPGDESKQHMSPVLLSRKKRPEEGRGSVGIRNIGLSGTRERACQHQKQQNPQTKEMETLKPKRWTRPQSAVTSRLSSLWPREKACRAQARGGGQRGEGASSRANSRR